MTLLSTELNWVSIMSCPPVSKLAILITLIFCKMLFKGGRSWGWKVIKTIPKIEMKAGLQCRGLLASGLRQIWIKVHLTKTTLGGFLHPLSSFPSSSHTDINIFLPLISVSQQPYEVCAAGVQSRVHWLCPPKICANLKNLPICANIQNRRYVQIYKKM